MSEPAPKPEVNIEELVAKQVAAELAKIVPTITGSLKSEIVKLMPKAEPKAEETATPSLEPKDKDSEIALLKGKLTRLENQWKSDKATVAEEKAMLKLQSALNGKVVDPQVTANYLMKAKQAVKIDDTGIAFIHNDLPYEVEAGVSEWLKSAEAKTFVPAAGPKQFKAPPVQNKGLFQPQGDVDFSKLSEEQKLAKAVELIQSQGLSI